MANDGGLASTANLCRAGIRAFSSEVGTGSREEKRVKTKDWGRTGSDFDQNRSGSRQGRL
jgi:hypothetical protein